MKRRLAAGFAALAAAAALPAGAQERPNTILVLDASGSMWGQIDGVNKIVIAREVVSGILADFPADQNLGLVAYGHRQRGQCSDIETLVAPEPGSAARIAEIVNGLNPRGMTPMTDAVIAAAQALRHTEQAATVILVSDGIETCNPDPCAAARALAEAGVDFTTHVIGFDVKGEAEALMQMRCLAEETGGRFLTADDAEELTEALRQVVAAPPGLTLTLSARFGDPALVEPAWRQDAEAADLPLLEGPTAWVVADPSGAVVAEETEGNPLTLELPAGNYVVTLHAALLERSFEQSFDFANGGARSATAEFPGAAPEPEPAPPAVTLGAPAKVVVGSEFAVTWEAEGEGLKPRDYVTIVPVGAPEGSGEYGSSYDRLQGRSAGALRAPAQPGLYEVRLQPEKGGPPLAATPVEVVEAEVSVSAPEQVVVGSEFAVSWEAEGLHPRDYVTILPAGAPEGEYGDYDRLQGRAEGRLRAPSEPGLYEVRLQLESSGRPLASTPVEVVEGEVSVTGPEQVRAETEISVSWTGAINPQDYVTIVPASAEDGRYANYIRVGSEAQGKLKAPAEPGLYEIRYQLDRGDRVMARHALEVLAADAPMDDGAGLEAPATAKPGETVTIRWTGGTESADQRIALARRDQADFSWIRAESALGRNELELLLPEAEGSYEIRYLDVAGRKVLGRSILEVRP